MAQMAPRRHEFAILSWALISSPTCIRSPLGMNAPLPGDSWIGAPASDFKAIIRMRFLAKIS
jgi:hypothetical protein